MRGLGAGLVIKAENDPLGNALLMATFSSSSESSSAAEVGGVGGSNSRELQHCCSCSTNYSEPNFGRIISKRLGTYLCNMLPDKISKQSCSKDTRKYFFSNTVVNRWNSLPDHIVQASSIIL